MVVDWCARGGRYNGTKANGIKMGRGSIAYRIPLVERATVHSGDL